MDELTFNNRLVASDWYDINFLGGFLGKDLKIKEHLNVKKFTVSNSLVAARTLNHWQQAGLISDDRPDGKGWRKFSLSEVVWIQIINKLRRFGMPLDSIKKVKSYLEMYFIDGNQSKFPELDFFIFFCLTAKKPIELLVFDSGEARLARPVDIDLAKTAGFIIDDYISIDINKLLKSILKRDDFSTDYLDYPMSPVLKEVNSALSNDDIKAVNIKVNKYDYLLEKKHIKKSKKEMEVLLEKIEYGRTEVDKMKKKKIYTVTEKKKVQSLKGRPHNGSKH